MIDEKLLQLCKMIAEWRRSTRTPKLEIRSAEDSEFGFEVETTDREGNWHQTWGVRDDRDDG